MAITVNQIAEKCGVSRTTVLRALNDNGRVSKETREKVLAIAEEYNIYTHEQRLSGFQAGATKNKNVEIEIIDSKDYLLEVENAIKNRKGVKTAFLCSGDSYALNIMRMASDIGLSIPKDFGIMGFDNINILDFVTPHLSTVSTNVDGVARSAVDELISQIENEDSEPRNILLNYEILDRETL